EPAPIEPVAPVEVEVDLGRAGLELVETHAAEPVVEEAPANAGQSRRRRPRQEAAQPTEAETLMLVETANDTVATAPAVEATGEAAQAEPARPRRRRVSKAASAPAEPLVMVETRNE
ncbi:MAG: hypothetical protein PHR30_12645, partial [Gallionellaceae bacterium]|nr:hypothetical protein [Gallionellaceae bacterium]